MEKQYQPQQNLTIDYDVIKNDGKTWKFEGKPVLPYFHTIQKMVLYETKARFYLVGSNQTESKFRLLKIDRTDPNELQLVEDPAHYNSREMKELLATIASVSRTSKSSSSGGGLVRTVSAFGILGFIRFLEGYYIILVTKRRKVATIGHHAIYKIEDTSCIYLSNEGPSKNPDELRYLKLFQSIDLSSNFYFAYSYDLTNTLQYNMTYPKHLHRIQNINSENIAGYGISNVPNRKFMWNAHLIKDIEGVLHPDWLLYIIHAFIGQSNICVYGRSIYLTLIARRSAQYAGTRFLKRGSNFQGHVANEVETEQIVFDATVSSFKRGRYTSFVQMRGSIPVHWSQDTAKMVAKPPISLDIPDPYAETAGKHFEQLLQRFGSPLVILNLVKKRERKRHESILTEEYVTAIKTLNQFLPPAHRIHYIGFDMARTNKLKEADVMSKLASISEEAIRKTKFFQSHRQLINFTSETAAEEPEYKKNEEGFGQRQTGLVRVNCVDCLDRTNTAQFALGKCALVHQLQALGVLDDGVHLEFESDAIRMLEELYEDHGDTLALQYGGSQLVHRINTYRKTAPWTSQGNDIMQTLSRYYSNTFSDADKQNAINLFLGVFQPSQEPSPLWTLENDIHLHLKPEYRFAHTRKDDLRPLTEWYSDEVMNSLPNSCHELEKTCLLLPSEDIDDFDSFSDFFKRRFFIPLSDVFAFKISHSIRDFMPHFTTEFSPFVVRVRPGKRQEEATSNKKTKIKNPSIMGLSTRSGASAASTSSEESDYSSSEEFNVSMTSSNFGGVSSAGNWRGQSQQPGESGLVFSKLFPDMKESYGVELKPPRKSDVSLYKRFVHFQQIPTKPLTFPSFPSLKDHLQIIPLSGFSKDSCYRVTPPTVSKVSRDIYRNYVQRGTTGATQPSQRDLAIYKRYVQQSGNPSHIRSK